MTKQTASQKISKSDWTVGAIYLFGAKRGLGREALVGLLVSRAGLPAKSAQILAGHWLTTLPFRKAA